MIRRLRKSGGRLGTIAPLVGSITALAADGQQMPAEYDQAMKTLDKKGDFKDNVLKINIPRNDLKVSIDGIATPTPYWGTGPAENLATGFKAALDELGNGKKTGALHAESQTRAPLFREMVKEAPYEVDYS